ncbi:MAE_28990/MAE_18760 family HEPN-like nuclease [Micromonospora sp. NPDC051141]|uniref:MAE_28990/MAE_18760 family HEPN-like nuclease n=1 Tax=Micromonospora sp. NPDC051141 TaxID=3364284 RepID=UPI0037B098B3
MKVRTLDALDEVITTDLAWRKKELSVFRNQVQKADRIIQRALLRGAISLLYAHWEGFIKNAAHAYLCYLSRLNLTWEQLRPEIVGLALRRELVQLGETNRSNIHARIVRQLREKSAELARIPDSRDAVRTMANLNFSRLEDILISIGCDCDRYANYRDLIDEQLLASRNRIVHGEDDYIALIDWVDLRRDILYIMDDVARQIVNAAALQEYRAEVDRA